MLIRLFMGIVFFLIFNHFFMGIEIHKTVIIALGSYLITKTIDYIYNKLKHGVD